MNFGVLEVANNTRAAPAPGWAYVPDTGPNAAITTLQPRKRARNQITASAHETTAKQDAKILRELAQLDRENHRDVAIAMPVKPRVNRKSSQAARKILSSQKTFLNHLEDFHAWKATTPATSTQQVVTTTPNTPIARAAPGIGVPHLTSKGTRSHKKKAPNSVAIATPLRKVSSVASLTHNIKVPNISMPDAPILSEPTYPPPASHPGDKDPLLVSRIPQMPDQKVIAQLLAKAPLNYTEAAGSWSAEDKRKPVRVFCELCGYWGRARCMRCGGKVCGLECLAGHQEECFGRYGA